MSLPQRILIGVLFVAAMSAMPAQARPRDEVMSNAYRCAAIGDSRQWLDCFYGAAQPLRAALGLKPAPPAQLVLVATPPAGSATASDVALRESVMAGVFRCGPQNEDRAWLDCYYAAAQPVRVSLGLAQGPSRPAVAPPPAGAQFGLPAPPPQEIPAGAKQVSARMASYSFGKTGFFTVTLANGQVWRQINGDTTFAHWKDAPDRYLVHITHGFLGSFNLQVRDNPGLFKVARVQ